MLPAFGSTISRGGGGGVPPSPAAPARVPAPATILAAGARPLGPFPGTPDIPRFRRGGGCAAVPTPSSVQAQGSPAGWGCASEAPELQGCQGCVDVDDAAGAAVEVLPGGAGAAPSVGGGGRQSAPPRPRRRAPQPRVEQRPAVDPATDGAGDGAAAVGVTTVTPKVAEPRGSPRPPNAPARPPRREKPYRVGGGGGATTADPLRWRGRSLTAPGDRLRRPPLTRPRTPAWAVRRPRASASNTRGAAATTDSAMRGCTGSAGDGDAEDCEAPGAGCGPRVDGVTGASPCVRQCVFPTWGRAALPPTRAQPLRRTHAHPHGP
jgi:hypothetical protein